MSLETPASRGDDFTSSPREVSIGAVQGLNVQGRPSREAKIHVMEKALGSVQLIMSNVR